MAVGRGYTLGFVFKKIFALWCDVGCRGRTPPKAYKAICEICFGYEGVRSENMVFPVVTRRRLTRRRYGFPRAAPPGGV